MMEDEDNERPFSPVRSSYEQGEDSSPSNQPCQNPGGGGGKANTIPPGVLLQVVQYLTATEIGFCRATCRTWFEILTQNDSIAMRTRLLRNVLGDNFGKGGEEGIDEVGSQIHIDRIGDIPLRFLAPLGRRMPTEISCLFFDRIEVQDMSNYTQFLNNRTTGTNSETRAPVREQSHNSVSADEDESSDENSDDDELWMGNSDPYALGIQPQQYAKLSPSTTYQDFDDITKKKYPTLAVRYYGNEEGNRAVVADYPFPWLADSTLFDPQATELTKQKSTDMLARVFFLRQRKSLAHQRHPALLTVPYVGALPARSYSNFHSTTDTPAMVDVSDGELLEVSQDRVDNLEKELQDDERTNAIHEGSAPRHMDVNAEWSSELLICPRLTAYYEVTIHSLPAGTLGSGRDSCVAVGLARKPFCLSGLMPGWDKYSFAWHGDDGNRFHCAGAGAPFGPSFGVGDTIGCGIDYSACIPAKWGTEHDCQAARIFFTLNGKFMGYAFEHVDVAKPLWPVIGLDTAAPVSVNFGVMTGSKKWAQWCFDVAATSTSSNLTHAGSIPLQSDGGDSRQRFMSRPFVFDIRGFERVLWKWLLSSRTSFSVQALQRAPESISAKRFGSVEYPISVKDAMYGHLTVDDVTTATVLHSLYKSLFERKRCSLERKAYRALKSHFERNQSSLPNKRAKASRDDDSATKERRLSQGKCSREEAGSSTPPTREDAPFQYLWSYGTEAAHTAARNAATNMVQMLDIVADAVETAEDTDDKSPSIASNEAVGSVACSRNESTEQRSARSARESDNKNAKSHWPVTQPSQLMKDISRMTTWRLYERHRRAHLHELLQLLFHRREMQTQFTPHRGTPTNEGVNNTVGSFSEEEDSLSIESLEGDAVNHGQNDEGTIRAMVEYLSNTSRTNYGSHMRPVNHAQFREDASLERANPLNDLLAHYRPTDEDASSDDESVDETGEDNTAYYSELDNSQPGSFSPVMQADRRNVERRLYLSQQAETPMLLASDSMGSQGTSSIMEDEQNESVWNLRGEAVSIVSDDDGDSDGSNGGDGSRANNTRQNAYHRRRDNSTSSQNTSRGRGAARAAALDHNARTRAAQYMGQILTGSDQRARNQTSNAAVYTPSRRQDAPSADRQWSNDGDSSIPSELGLFYLLETNEEE